MKEVAARRRAAAAKGRRVGGRGHKAILPSAFFTAFGRQGSYRTTLGHSKKAWYVKGYVLRSMCAVTKKRFHSNTSSLHGNDTLFMPQPPKNKRREIAYT